MKKLSEILNNIKYECYSGSTELGIDHLSFDSRNVNENTLFFAIKGTQVDGHDYLSSVVEKGCKAIVCQTPIANVSITQIVVQDSAFALGQISSNFYNNPSDQLSLIGVTGTNGKTTTVTLLYQLFTQLGYPCGLLSTVENKINNIVIPSTHTTPNPIELNKLLDEMIQAGCEYCFMEVSSHAVVQHRIAGLNFKGAVFTNITHDHLDYHGTFAAYIEAKKMFFDSLKKDAFALTNVDDKNGNVMLQNTKAKKQGYSLKTPSEFKGKVIENLFSGLVLQINGTELYTKLIGDFNAYNLLAVYGVALLLNQDKMEVLTQISTLTSVNGRFQQFKSTNEITAIVDYAHTPDALENVLQTINSIRTKNEQVITVVGCGGDRDKTKRPKMAAIACELSDKVILTSDNPRTEDPNEILRDMQEGVEGQFFNKTLTIVDREQAIKTAVAIAKPHDIILIAGKGHETYQEINGVKHHFDDYEQIKKLLK